MTLRERFYECIQGPWETAGDDIEFRIVDDGEGNKRVFFECTNIKQTRDLINDADFLVRLYKREPINWYTHKGFSRGFKSVIDIIGPRLIGAKSIYIAGYSAGGAYATLLHEWVWWNICPDVETWTFGAPRVCWMLQRLVRERFENLHRVYDFRDVFTHLPPWIFGYEHVGQRVRVGKYGWPTTKDHGNYYAIQD
ncbi:MAG: hypothetical protein WC455_24855 [Dehalococcoidia bacterium]|jgi:hypothetical protein